MFKGPLRISDKNPAYFTDESGGAIYLTGAHTWNNLVDMVQSGSDSLFDYPAYLEWMENHHYNFMRLWAWELLNWDTRGNRETNARILQVFPHPWARTGNEMALDGKPKFDLSVWDQAYFQRLEDRVRLAAASGIYVSVMLFEGWGLQFSPDAFENHPFHPGNNINGINGDVNGDGSGIEIHTLENRDVLAVQEAYVRKVIETLNEFDHVLYEIANECQLSSTEWQYHMIRLIKGYENSLPKQHPVGMTFQYRGGSNQTLFDSPADWISPNPERGYRDNPPPAAGGKVVITDTDHLWGIGGNSTWVWKSFLRGLNPIFMDPYDQRVLSGSFDAAWVEPLRANLGFTKIIADQLNLNRMFPDTTMISTGFCLSDPGNVYLFFLADTLNATIHMEGLPGNFACNWFDFSKGKFVLTGTSEGGGNLTLTSPFTSRDHILLMEKVLD
jgi:hypothetical protein